MSEEITDSSGSVFADLGLKEAEELSLKAALAAQVSLLLSQRNLTQRAAGDLLGIPQSHVSRIKNSKLDGISADRLMRMLLRLGRDIDIVIMEKDNTAGEGRITVATPDKDRSAAA